MTVSVLSAARTICELKDWSVSNLELQKILYIAHMLCLGETERPLIRESFEAWEYGPVVPELYSRARGFGSGPIPNIFHWVSSVRDEETRSYLEMACEITKDMTAGRLVSITHWENGAWYKCYRSGKRGIQIPNRLIQDEYRARKAA